MYILLMEPTQRFPIINSSYLHPSLIQSTALILMAKYNTEYSSSSLMLLHLLLTISFQIGQNAGAAAAAAVAEVDVGLILDADTIFGKIANTCISMGLEDFYASHPNYSTRLLLHHRDSKGDVVQAASAAIDLLKNVQVSAILGPQASTQANFVIDIGNKTKVPIISPATSPSLSPKENPYFIRAALIGSYQVKPVASIVKAFGWREIVLIYEDSSYGNGIVPHLTDALLLVNAQVRHRSVISISATDDHILQELYKLQTMQTRVFVLHMSLSLASRVFLKVKDVGMMSRGYVWITTDVTSFIDSMDSTVIESMQGVIGVKPYVPKSNELDKFKKRWRKRFLQENPDIDDEYNLNVFGLWAYSSVKALAMAVEKVKIAKPKFKKPNANVENLTDLVSIGTSEMGPRLLQSIRNMRFKDLSGEFNLVNGELQSSTFQIVNVNGKQDREIGFWTPKYGILKDLRPRNIKDNYTTSKEDLRIIIWPGESDIVPKGWEIPTSTKKKLRVGVPAKCGFEEFIKVETNPQTNAVSVTGLCAHVFEEVMDHYLPYYIPYEYIPFPSSGNPNQCPNYDDLVYQNFDVVVGDISIIANRSNFVDFTLPFTESGVSMIVPVKDNKSKGGWIFMKPLTMDLWLTIGAFFIFIGFVVWVIEHRINKEFRGPLLYQVGTMLWFSFSTLVFAHREKVISNLSRFVVITWMFVVLVVQSNYTASLTSMLTVQKLQPTVTDINALIKSGEYIGYQEGSFVGGLLKSSYPDPSKLKAYDSLQKFDEALSNGSKNNGVGAIVDELPYLRLFLAKYCNKYTMIGSTYKTAGFGFAFAKGSPLVPEVSRAILHVTEGKRMNEIPDKIYGKEQDCNMQDDITTTSESLTLDSFKGLFLIACVSSLSALIIFFGDFLYKNKDILTSNDSIREKVTKIAKSFDEKKDGPSRKEPTTTNEGIAMSRMVKTQVLEGPQSPAISIFHSAEGIFSQDEGLSTTEPGSPNQFMTLY
ncbi:glutamate receptor 2.7-like isoform X2 [Diospyros lotus]|uniref:glutamate receptor 2.7-like isoform X2 n=1 Tax=Diospyros lotus TaxID=55363 RepID=UPI00224E53AE|nr:glutamate receptor 2.7-like isoform X2 [Diospyros lotus]